MLDKRGDVVGVVDQIATGGSSIDSATGVGFAVPIDVVKPELSELERGATVTHAYLGAASGQSIIGQPGALVESVAAGSPAASGGLQPGDLITAIDGTPIHGPSALVAVIAAHPPGQKLTLMVKRSSSTLSVTVTLTAQPSTPSTAGRASPLFRHQRQEEVWLAVALTAVAAIPALVLTLMRRRAALPTPSAQSRAIDRSTQIGGLSGPAPLRSLPNRAPSEASG